jgi:nitrite reductase/ring-hydroxylating ferredoxin subunit
MSQIPRQLLFSSTRLFTQSQLQAALRKATFATSARTMAQEFKLKGLTSVDLKNGEKQEVEVEGVEKGKVLLAKINNEIHALSANCTHYGAPLVKGVLTASGRITCPWHGGKLPDV